MKQLYCIECNRPIKQRGRCLACNTQAKKRRAAQDRVVEEISI